MNRLQLFALAVSFLTRTECALQKAHEKPQAVKWMEAFFGRNLNFDQVPSLVNLINTVTSTQLSGCTPIVLYDTDVEQSDGMLLEQLFRTYPIPYVHGQITTNYSVNIKKMLKPTDNTCISYIMFMADVMRCKDVIGEQNTNRVVIVARSSQWRVYEFLASEVAREIEQPYILYTHKMYVDALGSSAPIVLTSWIRNKFTRPYINLFPPKISEGFAGHRFIISLANQPPFVMRRNREDDDYNWDGIEVRLVKMLAEIYNFTTDFRESKDVNILGSGDAITKEVAAKKCNLGIGGVYITPERIVVADVSQAHSQDCASFITLSSTALPRYRAIMGPFHWTVWLALTLIYLFAIFPLALSDKLTLRHLIENPEEIENMFWYVFGTFTNCFTFTGEASWGKSDKVTTRVLVGFYWIFTIITTACYTGSIIAFVTLPIFPETVDTTEQLIGGRFQYGTLDKGGWQYWFINSTDTFANKILKKIEFLPSVESGLRNVTKAFFWPYAFLGSKAELDFIVRYNFSTQNKRSVLHISKNCFVPYGVSLLFPLNSVYKHILNRGVLLAFQSGFMIKFSNDFEWEVMRSSTGKFLQANVGSSMKIKVDDRALTLDDTQGMFLLLAAGFVLGGACLLSEWLGGCLNFCKRKVRRLSVASIGSNPRSYDTPTAREKINSLQHSVHTRICSIADEETPNGFATNHADLVLHACNDDNKSASTDYDEEIDRIFNLESLFGESNDGTVHCLEEISDGCNVIYTNEK